MPFDPLILSHNTEARRRYLSIMQAALDAVDPYRAVRAHMSIDAGVLRVGENAYPLDRFRRVLVIGAGKAGAPMARATEDVLGDALAGGLVIVKRGHAAPTTRIEIVEAGHPIPTQAGIDAGERMLAMLDTTGADDLVIALLSGGGSALLEAPADGITLAELQAMTDTLLACGATINEINCLRKHVSRIKGGQLARAAFPATLITLVLSDVVGSPLDVIASGPTVPDRSTWQDAWGVVERYALQQRLPAAVLERLRAGLQGVTPDTPKAADPLFAGARTLIVGDNRTAAQAACLCAEELGYQTLLLTTFMEGEAKEAAKFAVALAKEVGLASPLHAPACIVLGGETTVTLGDAPGMGGRNQELALAAALALEGFPAISVASLATDGSDGPTDSAGALVDGETVARGRSLGMDATVALRGHDAYRYLRAAGDLLLTGPTQTNVNDLLFVWVELPAV